MLSGLPDILVVTVKHDKFIRMCAGCRVVTAKYRHTVKLGAKVFSLSASLLQKASSPCVSAKLVLNASIYMSHHPMYHSVVSFIIRGD